MRKIIIIILIFLFSCKENKKQIQNEIIVSIGKKDMLKSNSLLIELNFNNNSEINYLLPITPDYILENKKKMFNPVFGHIITSDFTDINDYKIKFLLENYTEKYYYKGFSHEAYKLAIQKYFEGYMNSLLFLPKKSKKRIFLVFNLYEYCNDSLKKCNGIFNDDMSKINLSIIDYPDQLKILDSLLKKEKINYKIYKKKPYFKDALLINK